jgi:hypothetical protein
MSFMRQLMRKTFLSRSISGSYLIAARIRSIGHSSVVFVGILGDLTVMPAFSTLLARNETSEVISNPNSPNPHVRQSKNYGTDEPGRLLARIADRH